MPLVNLSLPTEFVRQTLFTRLDIVLQGITHLEHTETESKKQKKNTHENERYMSALASLTHRVMMAYFVVVRQHEEDIHVNMDM